MDSYTYSNERCYRDSTETDIRDHDPMINITDSKCKHQSKFVVRIYFYFFLFCLWCQYQQRYLCSLRYSTINSMQKSSILCDDKINERKKISCKLIYTNVCQNHKLLLRLIFNDFILILFAFLKKLIAILHFCSNSF